MNAVGLDFGLSVETHRASLKAFAMKLAGNVDAANDLVQETMLKAIENQHQFQPGSNLGGWLFTILSNSHKSHARRAGRVIYNSELVEQCLSLSADDQAAAYDAKQGILRAMALPSHHRDPLMMIAVDGASYEDIARAEGVRLGTVRSRVSRAREELARRIGAHVKH